MSEQFYWNDEMKADPLYALIDEDGIVEDCDIETHYQMLCHIECSEEMGALRVFMDDGGVDLETRIPFDLLNKMGWQYVPPAVVEATESEQPQ